MQLKDTDIESQCDNTIVALIRANAEKFLALLTRENSGLSNELRGAVKQLQKSPRRHFSTGQTDIGLILRSGLSQTHLLIENKVMSPFTSLALRWRTFETHKRQQRCIGRIFKIEVT